MKKTIIILTILLLGLIGYISYESFYYIQSLNNINKLSQEKTIIIDDLIEKRSILSNIQTEYDSQLIKILEEDTGCILWTNLNETLKQIIK